VSVWDNVPGAVILVLVEVKAEVRGQPWRCERWRARREADVLEHLGDDPRIGEEREDDHSSGASWYLTLESVEVERPHQ
jgi:hypothetical protein